jgi:O-antigen ligase
VTSASNDGNTLVLPVVSKAATRVARFDAVRLLTVYAVLLFLIPATLIFAPLGGEGTPAMVLSLGIFFWYLASWISGKIEPSGGGRLVRMTTLVFAVAVLASFVAAMTRDISQTEVLAADSGLVWLASGAGLVVVVSETICEYARLEVLLRRLVILGSVIAVIGILQFGGIDLTTLMHIPGLTVNSQDVIALMDRSGFLRPQSTASQPIEFGVVMAMLLPLAVQQAFHEPRGRLFRRWAPVVLIGFAATLTVSRSGIIGIGVGFLVLIPTWKLRRILGALCAIALSAGILHFVAHGLITVFSNLFAGIFNGQDSSVNARVADYSGVAQYIAERPIFGRGFGTFLPQLYRYTDNMYLLATVEIGIVGALAVLVLFCSGIQSAALGRRRAATQRQRETGQALVASMAVALITSATFDSFTFPMFSGLFFLLLGCCGAYCTIMTAGERSLAPAIDLFPVEAG